MKTIEPKSWYKNQLEQLIDTATAVRKDAEDVRDRLKGMDDYFDEWVALVFTAIDLKICEARLRRLLAKLPEVAECR